MTDNKIAAAALDYCRRGLTPVLLKPRTKEPVGTAWQKQRYGEADIPRTSTGKVRLFALADMISARIAERARPDATLLGDAEINALRKSVREARARRDAHRGSGTDHMERDD